MNYAEALKPEREYQAVPGNYGLIYREVDIPTEDGLNINGWFFPGVDRSPEAIKDSAQTYPVITDQKAATIIICDGDAGNMFYNISFAWKFVQQGFNVLTFDWRGFGESDDWEMESKYLCYSEFLKDYDAAVEFAKEQPEVEPEKIGVFGYSTGAYLSFAVAARRDDIAAFVGRGLLTSFDEVIPLLKKVTPEKEILPPRNYPEELLPINAAENLKIPVFLIVGENDDRTPPWMSQKIMKKLTGEKELWIVEGAGHGGEQGPEYVKNEEFFRKAIAFFDKHLNKNE